MDVFSGMVIWTIDMIDFESEICSQRNTKVVLQRLHTFIVISNITLLSFCMFYYLNYN